MAFRVFVSYSTHDLGLATHVQQMLVASGAQVFVAEYSLPAGAALTPAIVKAIKSCDLFILLWSEHAKKSEWVPQEIGVARGCEKPVIPVLLQPGGEAPGFLRGLKYLPLFKNPTQALAWLRRHVAGLAAEKTKAQLWLGVSGVALWLLAQTSNDEQPDE